MGDSTVPRHLASAQLVLGAALAARCDTMPQSGSGDAYATTAYTSASHATPNRRSPNDE